MRKITALIFVFVIAAGLVGSVHLAFALYPEKSIQEIKTITEAEGLGEYVYVVDSITDKLTEALKDNLKRRKPEVYEENRTKGDSKYVLLGIGGTTLDPQPGPPKPASPETPKEHGMLPPPEPLTPQPESQGIGTVLPPSVATPGELSGHEQAKEETGSPKPATAKEAGKKRKKKGKTTAERAKTAKQVKPRSKKTVEKPSETSTGQAGAHGKHPSPIGVTKSLESPQGAGRPAPKPETKGPATPSSRKKEGGQSGATQRQGGQIQDQR
jgi:hypothetical protein